MFKLVLNPTFSDYQHLLQHFPTIFRFLTCPGGFQDFKSGRKPGKILN